MSHKKIKIPDYAKNYLQHRIDLAFDVKDNYLDKLVNISDIIDENMFNYLRSMVIELYTSYIKPNLDKEFIDLIDLDLLNSITYKSFNKQTVQYMEYLTCLKHHINGLYSTEFADHSGNMIFYHAYYLITHDTYRK